MAENGSMHIVCPHCTTSYAINSATLGEAGRTVRCARCKEVWQARPEDAIEPVIEPAMAAAGPAPQEQGQEQGQDQDDLAAEWNAAADNGEAPEVESPSIAADLPPDDDATPGNADWIDLVRNAAPDDDDEPQPRGAWFGSFLKRGRPMPGAFARSFGSLPTACAAMAALVMALLVWRADVVRLLPQTANFYSIIGLNVNLRGLAFKDVKVSTETVEGKPVLVIEGAIIDETRKAIDLPRLRFSVRDAQGAEIYAWNAVLDQTTLNPGEHAPFKSRLASPPAEGRSIDVRFFNKRDIAGGSI